jgi:hypothetical protein
MRRLSRRRGEWTAAIACGAMAVAAPKPHTRLGLAARCRETRVRIWGADPGSTARRLLARGWRGRGRQAGEGSGDIYVIGGYFVKVKRRFRERDSRGRG